MANGAQKSLRMLGREMTPTDRKIEIMNRVYASTVLRLTNDIIELKMEIERLTADSTSRAQQHGDNHDQRRDDDG